MFKTREEVAERIRQVWESCANEFCGSGKAIAEMMEEAEEVIKWLRDGSS